MSVEDYNKVRAERGWPLAADRGVISEPDERGFRREVIFEPGHAWTTRGMPPSQDYGRASLRVRHLLHGARGTVQFLWSTGVTPERQKVQDRGTRWEDFRAWDAEFGPFTLDAAAAPHNAKVDRYFTREDDGLAQSWAGERVWCNPPYSNLSAWLEKAWIDWPLTRGIVMLVPANRVEQKWWQKWVEPTRDQPGSWLRVRFLPGRLRFDRPGVEIGPKGDRPPFGCALLIWRDPATDHRESAWQEYRRTHAGLFPDARLDFEAGYAAAGRTSLGSGSVRQEEEQ